MKPHVLTESTWTVAKLKAAIMRLKCNKAANDSGLVAELLHHAPHSLLVFCHQLYTGFFFNTGYTTGLLAPSNSHDAPEEDENCTDDGFAVNCSSKFVCLLDIASC